MPHNISYDTTSLMFRAFDELFVIREHHDPDQVDGFDVMELVLRQDTNIEPLLSVDVVQC